MKPILCISLWQPWASLLVVDSPLSGKPPKRHETRHWRLPNKYLGRDCAIHAALHREPIDPDDELSQICDSTFGSGWRQSLFRGGLVGQVAFTDCIPTEKITHWQGDPDQWCGNFAPGRFAWRTHNAFAYDEPIPLRGQQGFWIAFREHGSPAQGSLL